MKLLYKRLFIMFSVALNIGFLIIAISLVYYHRANSFHERSWLELVDIIHRLELPERQENAALDTIKRFRVILDKHNQDVKRARNNIILALAKPGPVDQEQLHRLFEAADHQEKLKNGTFEAHVLDLRHQLGNEKGALFFSLLLEHLKSEHPSPHR